MKKKYVIRNLIQTDGNGRLLYYTGHFASGSWSPSIEMAKKYDSEEDAIWDIIEALKNEILELVTIYE